MRTTVAIDDKLLAKAEEFTGLHERSELLRGQRNGDRCDERNPSQQAKFSHAVCL